MKTASIIAATALLALQPFAATAQDAPPEAQAARTTPEADGVDQMVLAAQLADWGRRHQDADALRLAARILEQVPVRASVDSDAGETPVLTARSLRDEADALEQSELNDIVVTGHRSEGAARAEPPPPPRPAPVRPRQPVPPVVAPPPPVPVPVPPPPPPAPPPPSAVAPSMAYGVASSPFGQGPVSTIKRLGSLQRWGFEVDARASEILRVAAIGDGDTNVDLIVSDLQGRVLCDDRLGDHYPVCTVPAVSARRIRIDIVNRGPLSTKVQVLTN